MITTALEHRRDCPQDMPLRGFLGNVGDPMHRCPLCGAIGLAGPSLAAETEPATLDETPAPLLARYVCGAHLEEVVDGRGRGCRECVSEAESRRQR